MSAAPAVVDAVAGARAERADPLPVVLVVEHDPDALDVLHSDLARRFGNDFAVTGATSADAALAVLRELAAAGRAVALLLVDQRASEALLPGAHEIHPDARRVLLVDRDYSSTSPAVQALALGRADYHIVRPWADDETMYRAMSEYLAAWTREHEPRFELFRIVAPDGDARALQLRDVLTRFSLPFTSHASDGDGGRDLLAAAGLDATRLPVVIRRDGQVMIDPGLPEIAHAIGVDIENHVDACDLAIVGAGPAGLTAAVYAASEGLETVLLERGISGGQAGTSPMIRNYPGFPHGIAGGALMERTCEQAWLMGAHIVFTQRAMALARRGDERVVRLGDGTELRARAVIVATGIEWRRLGVPRLEALVGAGVFYGAAVSESRALHGREVLIIGAGNSAGQAAVHLARHARSVTLLVRGRSLATSMSTYLVHAIASTPNITVRLRTEVVDGGGSERLEYVRVADRGHGTVTDLPADALFVMIGGEPHTRWLPDDIDRDRQGCLLTGRDVLDRPGRECGAGREPLPLETSLPGVFAAGDVRHGSIKRVASAVGDGATATRLVHEYLRDRAADLPPERRAPEDGPMRGAARSLA